MSRDKNCSLKMYLTLTFNFEAVATLISGILGSHVSPDLYCLIACLYAKCCDLIGWILEPGPSIYFRMDGPDHLYGFRSKLKHRIFGKMVEKLSTEVVKC